jgi:Type II secretion system (T2SS), protein N
MPASRSPSRDPKAAANSRTATRSRAYWPLILIGLATLGVAVVAALPASVIKHFLPPDIVAEDFSGSLWHGSAGKIRVRARDTGALEWWLHPAALFGMTLNADLHWVKVGFVIDATVNLDRHGYAAHDIKGGGPIEDLSELGVAPGWRGIAEISLSELRGDFAAPRAAAGDVKVSNLTSPQIADGADLGSYVLRVPAGSTASDGTVTAELTDTGGPLELRTVIHYSPKDGTGILSGTLKERAGAPPALRSQLQNLSRLRGRDPQGRIPVDLEIAL